MALPLSLIQDLTRQDKRKMAAIVLTMTIGLPVYVALMSLSGVMDMPTTAFFVGFTAIIGFGMSLLMLLTYVIANKFTP